MPEKDKWLNVLLEAAAIEASTAIYLAADKMGLKDEFIQRAVATNNPKLLITLLEANYLPEVETIKLLTTPAKTPLEMQSLCLQVIRHYKQSTPAVIEALVTAIITLPEQFAQFPLMTLLQQQQNIKQEHLTAIYEFLKTSSIHKKQWIPCLLEQQQLSSTIIDDCLNEGLYSTIFRFSTNLNPKQIDKILVSDASYRFGRALFYCLKRNHASRDQTLLALNKLENHLATTKPFSKREGTPQVIEHIAPYIPKFAIPYITQKYGDKPNFEFVARAILKNNKSLLALTTLYLPPSSRKANNTNPSYFRSTVQFEVENRITASKTFKNYLKTNNLNFTLLSSDPKLRQKIISIFANTYLNRQETKSSLPTIN